MKTKTKRKPRQPQLEARISCPRQVCEAIPPHLVPELAREHGVDEQANVFSPGSHVTGLVFTQLKKNLKPSDFLGYNEDAVRWPVWAALLTFVLLRFLGHVSGWAQSFSRLGTLVRAALWEKLALRELLVSYGTAGGSFRRLGRPDQAYLPGLEPFCGTAGAARARS